MSRRRQKKRSQKARPPHARGGRRLLKAAVVLVGVAILFTALAAGLLLSGLVTGGGPSGPRKAAIVDQLSLTQSNPDFVASATSILEQAGYTVDYFPGEQVTVNLYRNLPARDYELIILRVHSGLVNEVHVGTGEVIEADYVSLFTGEPYSETKYVEEVKAGPLGRATYYEGAPPLFGVGPDFVTHSMRGSFDKTLIVLMGCDGLRSPRTGQAFLDKGASAFVGWSRAVSASHSDAATLRLLEKLLVNGLPLADAVAQTAAEVGPDPSHGAELRVLPEGG